MALIKSTDEILQQVDIAKSFSFEKIKPFLKMAENDFLIKILSKEQYEDLLIKYEELPNTPIEEPYARLLELSQICIVYYGILLYSPNARISFTNAGIMQNRPNHSAPSTQWEHRDFVKFVRNTADTHIEHLLEYLEENANVFTMWASSTAFTQSKETFINKASDFSTHITIGSRTTFKKLIPFMKKAESLTVKRIIGKAQYKELKEQYLNNTLTEVNQILLENLKPLIAYKSIIKAFPTLSISSIDDGIRVNNFDTGVVSSESLTAAQSKLYLDQLNRDFEEQKEDFKLFLEEKITDYPLYAASSGYSAKAVPGPKHTPTNKVGNKSYTF